jgi:hypothetical protein
VANTNSNLLAAAPTYTLTWRSKDTLAYHSDGRLAKALHGAGLCTQYDYGFNAVIAKSTAGSITSSKKKQYIWLMCNGVECMRQRTKFIRTITTSP